MARSNETKGQIVAIFCGVILGATLVVWGAFLSTKYHQHAGQEVWIDKCSEGALFECAQAWMTYDPEKWSKWDMGRNRTH
jgi:hypothetical protein